MSFFDLFFWDHPIGLIMRLCVAYLFMRLLLIEHWDE